METLCTIGMALFFLYAFFDIRKDDKRIKAEEMSKNLKKTEK